MKHQQQKSEKSMSPQDILFLSKNLLHDYYNGNYTRWFEMLDSECIWIGTGQPVLLGADAIRLHFKQYETHPTPNIYSEEYYLTPSLESSVVQVYGWNIVGPNDDHYRVSSFFTLTWKNLDNDPRLISHHFSYEFINKENTVYNQMVPMDLTTRKFIQGLLLNHPPQTRIPIKSIREIIYLDPNTVIYAQKEGRHAELVCIDRIINSTMTLDELEKCMPTEFYRFHRSYLVNIRYITTLKRYQLGLVAGIILPVPERTYMKIKKELQEKLKFFSAPINL